MNLILTVAWLAVFVLGARQWATDLEDGRPSFVGCVMVLATVWALAEPLAAAVNGLTLAATSMVLAIASIVSGGWS
jgi:hypothetical protein